MRKHTWVDVDVDVDARRCPRWNGHCVVHLVANATRLYPRECTEENGIKKKTLVIGLNTL